MINPEVYIQKNILQEWRQKIKLLSDKESLRFLLLAALHYKNCQKNFFRLKDTRVSSGKK